MSKHELGRRSLIAASAGAALAAREVQAGGIDSRMILERCRDTALRASMAMDANDVDAMLLCYTDHLEFVRPSTWPSVSIRGKAEFASVLRQRPQNFVSRHLFTNSIAEMTGEGEVICRSYFVHYSASPADGAHLPVPIEWALRSVGEYEDIMILEGGEWRIKRRTGRFIFGGI